MLVLRIPFYGHKTYQVHSNCHMLITKIKGNAEKVDTHLLKTGLRIQIYLQSRLPNVHLMCTSVFEWKDVPLIIGTLSNWPKLSLFTLYQWQYYDYTIIRIFNMVGDPRNVVQLFCNKWHKSFKYLYANVFTLVRSDFSTIRLAYVSTWVPFHDQKNKSHPPWLVVHCAKVNQDLNCLKFDSTCKL